MRKLQKDDIFNALVAGWNDLKRAPEYGLTVGALYALGGWVAIYLRQVLGPELFHLSLPHRLRAGRAVHGGGLL